MSKKQEYYPLQVCKTITSLVPSMAFTTEEMRVLTERRYSHEAKEAVVSTSLRRVAESGNRVSFKKYEDLTANDLKSMDFYSTVLMWSKNKQVYRFDKDFLNELVETENLHMTKDAWDYLPCNVFYLDFSGNPDLMEQFELQGVFLNVVKDEVNDTWELHTFRMKEGLLHKNYVMNIPNAETDYDWSIFHRENSPMEFLIGEDKWNERKINAVSLLMIPQVLSYLSSVEPDIRESESTKQVYRKPDAKAAPKNKFSEIHQEEVGVRFGTAFRKWSVAHKSPEPTGKRGGTAGHTKRPHFRKAHWQHFWYNVTSATGEPVLNQDGSVQKVRRPKWVQASYVNEKLGESDAVIHKVSKSSQQKERE